MFGFIINLHKPRTDAITFLQGVNMSLNQLLTLNNKSKAIGSFGDLHIIGNFFIHSSFVIHKAFRLVRNDRLINNGVRGSKKRSDGDEGSPFVQPFVRVAQDFPSRIRPERIACLLRVNPLGVNDAVS